MPAAAVIPAPIAYIKVVAVKKLVVEPQSVLVGIGLGAFLGAWLLSFGGSGGSEGCYSKQAKFPRFPSALTLSEELGCTLLLCPCESEHFTLKKLECSKQAHQA